MNTISKAILGFIVIAVFASLWFILTQKNKGGSNSGCSGNCASCGSKCTDRKEEKDH